MRALLIFMVCLAIPALADPKQDEQSLKEIRAMLAQIKAKSAELEKMSRGLEQLEHGEEKPSAPKLGIEPDWTAEKCGSATNVFDVQNCVLHSVKELRKLSDELE